jgi:beta-glucosidase
MYEARPDARIEALIATMSLTEKIGQLVMIRPEASAEEERLTGTQLDQLRQGRAGSVLNISEAGRIDDVQAIALQSRLGIPLLFCLDVLHGFRTIFPIPLAEAASFDPSLWEATARAAAEEASAAHIALTFAPMLDVARDLRWGRMAESPGEDPWLAARFATAKVRGFQQGFAGPKALAATAKHLGAYGAVTAGREYNSVDISARTLHEVHLPAFATAVREGVAAIMPSFNDLGGVPMTANRAILRDVVRGRWGFEGVIVSDFGAVAELVTHGVAADLAEAAALALKAGIDIDMVSDAYSLGLPAALERGLVEEPLIDAAAARVLTLKARLGLLDDPFRGRGEEDKAARPPAHRDLAREAARRSIVLMQNRGDILPIKGESGRLAVIGPLADDGDNMLGPWWAAGRGEEAAGFLAGLRDALPGWSVAYEKGCQIADQEPDGLKAAVEAASRADIVLLCLGESKFMSGEAASRAEPGLPQCQRELAEAVLSLGKPTAVTLSSGRPLTAPSLFERAGAVLATWFLGTEAGHALADILTGRSNPCGKLPVTWPRHVGQAPIFYAHRPTGRPCDPSNSFTSRYADMPLEPLFPFGHGLSYTRFAYRDLRLSAGVIRPGETVAVEADISNEGAAAGEETALMFIRDPVASVARPVMELRGAARLALQPGETGTARFTLSAGDLAFPDEAGSAVLEAGEVEIIVAPRADRAAALIARLEVRLD